jgi:hypothetical protein
MDIKWSYFQVKMTCHGITDLPEQAWPPVCAGLPIFDNAAFCPLAIFRPGAHTVFFKQTLCLPEVSPNFISGPG